MTEKQAAEFIVGEIAYIIEQEISVSPAHLWRAAWALSGVTERSHLLRAARDSDKEYPETAARMPWASDVARWAEGQREVARV